MITKNMHVPGANNDYDTDLCVDIEHLRTIFEAKEDMISHMKEELQYFIKDGVDFKSDNRDIMVKLKLEMIDLMERGVNLWKQLLKLNTTITALHEQRQRTIFPRERAASVSLSETEVDAPDKSSVTHWLQNCLFHKPEASSRDVVNYENNSETDSQKDILEFSEDGDTTHVMSHLDKDFELTHKHNTLRDMITMRNNSRNTLIKEIKTSKMRPSGVCSDNFISQKDVNTSWLDASNTFEVQTILDSSFYFKHRFHPNIMEWSMWNFGFDKDLGGTLSDIFSSSTKKGINPRRKLHRQGRINDSVDFDHTPNVQVYENIKAVGNENGLSENGLSKLNSTSSQHTLCNHAERVDFVIIDDVKHSKPSMCESNIPYTKTISEEVDNEDNSMGNDICEESCMDGSEHEDEEIEDINNNFLIFRDGFVSCRILTPTLEEEIRRSSPINSESDDFEYLTITDGRVTFTPSFHDDIETNDPFSEAESYNIDTLYQETADKGVMFENIQNQGHGICYLENNPSLKEDQETKEQWLTTPMCNWNTSVIHETDKSDALELECIRNIDLEKLPHGSLRESSVDSGFGDEIDDSIAIIN